MYPHSTIPEYTLSLLIWIVPLLFFGGFFIVKRLLTQRKSFALLATVTPLAAVGCVLDLLFGKMFFFFPNADMVLRLHRIRGMPVEEFVFYVTGFWFIMCLYVFCDEWFLKKYNRPDEHYARFRDRLKKTILPHWWSLGIVAGFLVIGVGVKHLMNPDDTVVPGYFFFLACVAYTPMVLFYRVSRGFVNWQAFWFTLVVTVLVSVIWEATLALPRGYWDYHHQQMLGIFIGPWHDLPIEAVTVWIFCTLVIIVYEFAKIVYFTPVSRTAKVTSPSPFIDT
jgi:lycopene cyclase domain-containing protein